MRFGSDPILTNGSMSASLNSFGVDLQQVWGASIQVLYTGVDVNNASGLGTMQIQGSNDNVQVPLSGPQSGTDPAKNVTNWTNIPSSTYNVTVSSTSSTIGSSSYMFDIKQPGFRWIRLSYTAASGSGIMSANYFGRSM